MNNSPIEIHGLDELIKRMIAYPQKLTDSVRVTMQAVLLALWENVPPYPPPPEDSTYVRTGTLGRTLGSGFTGGQEGQPDVFMIKELGSAWEAHFGSNLDYAPFVVGDEAQAEIHQGRWWTIKVIAEKASDKIDRLFDTLAQKLADFLEKGS